MKQLRWIWALGITAVLLIIIFIAVDLFSKEKAEKAAIGGPKQLISIDSDSITRLTIDNEEGHFAFDWSDADNTWVLVSSDQFSINTYAVAAISTYICDVQSEKTIAFDCDNPEIYGFDSPIILKVFTTDTDEEHPYILYVGDSTPTYDAYYAMVDGSDDVYTINYNSGSIFCAAKDTLRNQYLFDSTTSQFHYYKLERDGKTVTEFSRTAQTPWELKVPAGFDVSAVKIDDLVDILIRVSVSSFEEEHPDDLAQYGLDHPHTKIWMGGKLNGKETTEEIWFGSNTSEDADALEMYGYFVRSELVFRIKRTDVSFLNAEPTDYMLPYCINVGAEELQSVEIDMGDVYDMHETLFLDYENNQFALGEIDITDRAMDNLDVMTLFNNYFRAISSLNYTALELDAKPDPNAEPAIRIIYTYLDGKTVELDFLPQSENSYYLFKNGSYSGLTVRLNRFTGNACVTDAYTALKNALKS